MPPVEVVLEPRRQDEPVRAGQRWAAPGAGDQVLPGGTDRNPAALAGPGTLAGPGILAGRVIEVRQPQPQRVGIQQALQPDLGMPLLHRRPHARRQVDPEPPVAGHIQHRRGTVVAQPPRALLKDQAAR